MKINGLGSHNILYWIMDMAVSGPSLCSPPDSFSTILLELQIKVYLKWFSFPFVFLPFFPYLWRVSAFYWHFIMIAIFKLSTCDIFQRYIFLEPFLFPYVHVRTNFKLYMSTPYQKNWLVMKMNESKN